MSTRLAAWLASTGTRQRDFAVKVGTSGPHMSRLVNGAKASPALARRIHEATDKQVSIESLLFPEEAAA